MNAGLTLATIISMLLTIAGSNDPSAAKKKQQEAEQQLSDNKDSTTGGFLGTANGVVPTGQNLNHNEHSCATWRRTNWGPRRTC